MSIASGCKKEWKPDSPTDYFVGPLTILTLLYVDCTYCPGINEERTENPLRFWTKTKLSSRANMEIMKGGFGNCVLRDQYIDTHAYENDNEDQTKRPGVDGVEELLVVGEKEDVQGQVRVLERVVDYLDSEKLKIRSFLDDTVEVFGDSEEVSNMVMLLKSINDNGLYDRDEDVPIQQDHDVVGGGNTLATIASSSGTLKRRKNINRKEKRTKQPSTTLCSPYVARIVSIDTAITPVEKKVCDYVISGCIIEAGDQDVITSSSKTTSEPAIDKGKRKIDASMRSPMDEIYVTTNGFKMTTLEMGALPKGDVVSPKIIDMCSIVLNHDKRLRSGTSPHRLFANTQTLPSKCLLSCNSETDDNMLTEFAENLQHLLGERSDVPSLRSFDIVLFPIVEKNRPSLYIYDFKRMSVVYMSPLMTKISPSKLVKQNLFSL